MLALPHARSFVRLVVTTSVDITKAAFCDLLFRDMPFDLSDAEGVHPLGLDSTNEIPPKLSIRVHGMSKRAISCSGISVRLAAYPSQNVLRLITEGLTIRANVGRDVRQEGEDDCREFGAGGTVLQTADGNRNANAIAAFPQVGVDLILSLAER